MAKHIEMTRARKQALPTVLEMARAYLETNEEYLEPRDKRRFKEALEAFDHV